MARATLCLLGVQALHGGVNLFLRVDGECVAQRVTGGEERRYEFGVPADEAMELMRLVKDEAFSQNSLPVRNGVGDEATIIIQLMEEGVRLKTVWKWANDREARFDAIYDRMKTMVESQPEDSWVCKREYEWDYRPDWMKT